MNKFVGYRCSLCGEQYSPTEITYTCPKDGGNLDVVLDYDAIKNKYKPEDILSRSDPSLWRFLPLLPVQEPPGSATPLHVAGGTPVYRLARLTGKLGLQSLWLKDESRNPTASFKDRASAIVVARAQEIKAEVVVTASTGNAGAAWLGCLRQWGRRRSSLRPNRRRRQKWHNC
jgi:threonine synthase